MLTARPGTEVGTGQQYGDAGVLRLVEDEVRIAAPGGEQPVLEPAAGHPLQVGRRDDLVGVDVAAAQGDGPAGVGGEGFHRHSSQTNVGRSAGAVSLPVTAVAAATPGDTRCVRPPGPWRPSKLRLDVEAARSPGASLSVFIARHIEQPAPRHSKPALVNTLSRPSASAASFT